jgi:CBS domain-containing protein
MVENDIGGVPLVDGNGKLMGVVTRRDVIMVI